MYGQTTSMYKTLVDAYHTVLVKMREKNLVLPMAMIMAICGGMAPAAQAASVYWGPSINNAATPWDGTWDTGTSNWNSANPALTPATVPYGVQSWASGDIAIFARPPAIGATDNGPPVVGGVVPPAPYTVTVTENVTAGGIQFTHPGYTLTGTAAIVLVSGSHITLGTAPSGVGTSIDATISGTLASNGGIIKDGEGTLYLAGTNNGISSTTGFQALTVNTGKVQIGDASGAGTSGTLGTGAVTLNGATTQLRLARADTATVSNAIGGTGSLAQVGTGTTILTGGNSYSGGTTITRGTLQIGDAAHASSLGTGNVVNDSNLTFRNAGTVANIISGAGNVENIGGSVILSGTNAYTGKTTVTAGTMRIANMLALSGGNNWDADHIQVRGGATLEVRLNELDGTGFTTARLAQLVGIGPNGSGTDTVDLLGFNNNATLALDTGAVDFVHNGGITDPIYSRNGVTTTPPNKLNIRKLGTAALKFNGGVSYTGTTTFVANPGAHDQFNPDTSTIEFTSGTLTGNIIRTGTDDYVGNIIMSGANADAALANGAVLTLSGTNTYTGTTTVNSGTLQFAKQASLYNNGFITVTGGGGFGTYMWTQDKIHVASGATLALNVGGSGEFTAQDVEDIYLWSNGFAAGAILGLDTSTAAVPFGSTEHQFVYDRSITNTFNGSLGLAKRGEGTLVLTEDNTYTGPTYIYAGTLQLGTGGATGGIDSSSSITNNGTLEVNLSRTDVVLNNIHGTGGISQIGSGTTTMNGLNDYKGDTWVWAGTLRAGSVTAFGDNYTAATAPTVLGSNAKTTVSTNGTLDLAGFDNTIGTLLGQGQVALGGGTLTVAGGRRVEGSSTVTAFEPEFSGRITGPGNLVMDASAQQKLDDVAYGYNGAIDPRQVLVLSGDNDYTGTTTITYGTLQVGNGGLTGTLGQGDITVDSTPPSYTGTQDGAPFTMYGLDFNRGGTLTLNNAIHGTGSIGITGTGTVELAGASDHTGEISVKSGILKVTGATQSDITVDPTIYTISTTSGQTTTSTEYQRVATLAGNGSTTGVLGLAGGSFILGASSGQAFKANGGAYTYTTNLWTDVTTTSGATSTTTTTWRTEDKVIILDGSTAPAIGSQSIDVLEYAGFSPGAANFDASKFRSGNLTDTGSKITLTYDRAARVWNSGLGNWDNLVSASWTGTDTLDGTGANFAKKFSSGDFVLFDDSGAGAGSTRTVNLNTQVAPGEVVFNNSTSRYVVTGTGGITGITNLVKDGTETTILDTDNTYTGTTTVNAGVLRIGNGGMRGTLGQGDVTLNGNSVLLFGRGDDSSVNASSTDFSPTTTVTRPGNWHPVLINNHIGGTGSVGQVGTLDNIVILGGNNTYTGTTSVNSGALAAGSDTAFGINSATTVDLGAILWLNDGVQDHDIALGSLDGGGFVVANGVGRGNNLTLTFAGNAAGTSTVFNGQFSDINRSYNFTVGLTTNDRIRITDVNGNGINYQNERSLAGLLVDSAGTHKDVGGIWVDSTSGTATDPAANLQGKTWVIDNTGKWYKVMYAPVLGNGWNNGGMAADLIKEGVGTQTLAGDNTYTGATFINGGVLQVGNGGSLANRNTDLLMGGQLLDAHGTLGQTSAVAIASGATLAFNRVDNALVWGADAWLGNNLYAGGKDNSLTYTWPDRVRGALVVSADISGAGTIRQIGTGTTTLTGDQSGFAGAVVVDAGTLRIGDEIIDTIIDLAHTGTDIISPHLHQGLQTYADGTALGDVSSTVTVNSAGTLAFNLANDYTETHAITGAGNVAHTGSNTLTLEGDSAYTGKTTVASTVARYRTAGPGILTNLTVADSKFLHYDLVIGGVLRAGVDSVLNTAGTGAVSGAFGVQSVVSVNAGATLDLNGHSQYIGALHSDGSLVRDASGNWVADLDPVTGKNRYALTDGNSRVAEYAPSAEQHAGTPSDLLGTAGTAVVNFWKEVNNSYDSSSIAVGVVDIGSATLAVGDGNKSGNYAGVLTGGGTLVKIGTGTQILSGDSDGPVSGRDYTWLGSRSSTPASFSGAVHIQGGTLQLGDGTLDPLNNSHGSIGTGTVAVDFGATFAFNRANDTVLAIVNQISGRGSVRQFGPGTTVLSGNNTYTGITQVDNGILRAGGDLAFGTPVTTNATTVLNTIGGAVVNGGMLDLANRNIQFGSLNGAGGIVNLGTSPTSSLTIGWFGNVNDAYSGIIQGAGNLTKTGTGIQTLAGASTYTGATNVVAGMLQAGVATVGGITPTSGAFGVNSAMTLGGTMYGSPVTAIVDLNGFDQTLGSLASTASLANTVTNSSIVNDATLTLTGANTSPKNFAGTLSDGASKKINIVKTGAGTQTFSGQFTYSGTTTVNGGKLVLDYAQTTSASQKGALSLGGGEVQFDNLGTVNPSFVSTTITATNSNKLTLGAGWSAFSAPDASGQDTSRTYTGTGVVNLGTLNYISGALDVSNITTSQGWVKITGLGGQINYTDQTFLFNGLVTANGGQNLVGTDPTGYLITAQTADFSQGGAIGDPFGPAVTAATAIRLINTGYGGNQINQPITLYAAGVTDVTTVLNAYTGQAPGQPNRTDGLAVETLSIGAGNTLRLAAQGAILSVAGSDLTLSGGTLTAGGADNTAGTITVNVGIRSAVDPIVVKVTSAITDNGTGSVGLTKVGLGTLTIAAPGGLAWDLANPASHPATGSTYSGTTTIAQGTLKVGADYAMSYASQVVLNAGIFTPGSSGSAGTWISPVLDLDNHNVRIGSLKDGDLSATGGTTGAVVSLGTGGLTIGEDGLNAVFSGVITSGSTSNGLTKVGSGKQILAGDNTLAGTVKIYGGTLQMGNGGTTGNFGSAVTAVNTGTTTANGTLAFNRGDLAPVVFTPTITGFGGVAQNGTSTVVLSGANNYQGATAVNSGILQAGVASTLNSGAFGVRSAVNVVSGATLALNGFNNAIGSLAGSGAVTLGSATLTTGTNNLDASFAGTISGPGGLTKTGTGTQTITGVNTYSGPTTVSQGTLALDYAGGSNRLSATSSLVLNGGSLVFENLGNKTQSFASTMVSLTVPTTPFILSQTGWTSGVVNLGNLGGVSGIASWVGSLDIQNLASTPSWIRTSDSRYASVLNWSGKAASGSERVATDANGYFITVTTTDYSQGGAIGDPAGPSFANTDVVRLISTGYGGISGPNVANAPITLFALGTTDVKGIFNEYAAGTTNPTTNSTVTLQIGASQTLRTGSFGVSNFGAGIDLAITGGSLTSSTGAVAFNAGTRTITVGSTIVDSGGSVGITQNGGTTILTGTNINTGITTINAGTLQVGNGGAIGQLGAGAVDIAGGTLAFNHSDAVTLSNAVTGTGTLAQNGASTLTVNNASGFAGNLAVNAGTLNFTTPAALNTVAIASGATLSSSGGVLGFAGMANNGSFQIGATGQVNLTGANQITGSGTVTNAGAFNMAAGSGMTNALVNNGTMNVTGSVATGALTFNSLSVLKLADSDAQIVSSGTATVNSGASLVVVDASGFTLGHPQKIIDANGATGSFHVDVGASDALTGNLHWVNVVQDGDIYLGVQHTLDASAADNTQRAATSNALTKIGETIVVNQNLQDGITYLSGLSGAAYGVALDHLSGHDRAALDSVTQEHTLTRGQNILQFAQMQLVNDETVVSRSTDRAMRATALGDLEYGDIEDVYGLQFFVHAEHVSESRDQQTTGVLSSEATGNVFTVGVHNQLTDDFNIGAAFTYDQANITTGSGLGKSDAKTFGLDVYFSHLFDESQRWFISGVAGVGRSTYDNSRSGIMPGNVTATGSATGTQFHVAGQLGYRADVWRDAILTPYGGLSMVRNSVNGYAESLPGAPGLALSYEAHTSTATEAVLGLNFAQGVHFSSGYLITPSLGLAWHHQLGNSDSNTVTTHFAGASGTAFNTYLSNLPDDAVEIQGAVSLQIPGGLKVFVDGRHYASMGSSNGASQNRIGAGLRYDF